MKLNTDEIKDILNLIKSMVNLEKVKVYHVPILNNFAIKLLNQEHYSIVFEKLENELSMEIHHESGFDNFYEIFPNAPHINFEQDKQIINKYRFLNTFLTGQDFQVPSNSIDDYKFYYFHDGDNYNFSTRIQGNLPNNMIFFIRHNFFLNLLTKNIEFTSFVIYRNHNFMKKNSSLSEELGEFNDKSIQYKINCILNEHAAIPLEKDISELLLTDYQLLNMLNFR